MHSVTINTTWRSLLLFPPPLSGADIKKHTYVQNTKPVPSSNESTYQKPESHSPQECPVTQSKHTTTEALSRCAALMKFHTRVIIITTTAKPERSLWWWWLKRATIISHWLVREMCASECQSTSRLQTKQRSEESHELWRTITNYTPHSTTERTSLGSKISTESEWVCDYKTKQG